MGEYMIRIAYDELGKMNFQQAVQKLANSQLRTPEAFLIKHLTKSMREGFFAMREAYVKEIQDKFAVTGKEGAPEAGGKSAEMKLPFECKPGMEEEAKRALDGFGKKELVVDKRKIKADVLFQCNEWSPRELEVLEPILEEPADL
jgi:hypothetical protein